MTAGPPKVVVVAAFHRPEPGLARAMVESLLSQRGVELSVVAVLDGAETMADAGLLRLIEHPAVTILARPQSAGVSAAFAHGLGHALAGRGDEACFAYADQDDVWHGEKLKLCIQHLRERAAELVHCDARVVGSNGKIIAPSLHRYEYRVESRDLLETILLNSVTGMTAVFTRATAELALALLGAYRGPLLHDHLTAVAAASLGTIAHLDEALVDYMQHGANQLGARRGRLVSWLPGSISWQDTANFRATSRRLFLERRELVQALDRVRPVPQRLRAAFMVEPHTPLARFVWAFDAMLLQLALGGRSRHARLCFRMYDGAVQTRWAES